MQGRQCIAFTWHTGHKQGRLRQQGFLPQEFVTPLNISVLVGDNTQQGRNILPFILILFELTRCPGRGRLAIFCLSD
jgi:hypothetical protein